MVVGASTERLGVGITCRGGGRSAKGEVGWTWGWIDDSGVVVGV